MRRKVQAKATNEQERSGDVGEINGVFSVGVLWASRYYKTDGSQNGPIDKVSLDQRIGANQLQNGQK